MKMDDGKRLKKLIEKSGYKIKWIAENICDPPVSTITINNWLNHGIEPGGLYGLRYRDQISKFFKTSFWGGEIE